MVISPKIQEYIKQRVQKGLKGYEIAIELLEIYGKEAPTYATVNNYIARFKGTRQLRGRLKKKVIPKDRASVTFYKHRSNIRWNDRFKVPKVVDNKKQATQSSITHQKHESKSTYRARYAAKSVKYPKNDIKTENIECEEEKSMANVEANKDEKKCSKTFDIEHAPLKIIGTVNVNNQRQYLVKWDNSLSQEFGKLFKL